MFTESCLIIALACLYRFAFVCVSQEEMRREIESLKEGLVSEVATSTCIRMKVP